MIDTKLGREAAELRAIALSENFHHHGYNAEGDIGLDEKKTAMKSTAL
jgi:hypothetical protein